MRGQRDGWGGRRARADRSLGAVADEGRRRRRHRRSIDVHRCERGTQRNARRDRELGALRVARSGVPGRIARAALMEVHEARVIEPYRARVRMDQGRDRLQGDEQPEHQGTEGSLRHVGEGVV